jgi:hypothetical protein
MPGLAPGIDVSEHFSAKWIRFAVKKCGTSDKRADSMSMEAALGTSTLQRRGWPQQVRP